MLFQYTYLDENSIRLVHFDQRTDATGEIRLTLEHQSNYVDESVHYIALAPIFTDKTAAKKTVVLNGRTRMVSASLRDALEAIWRYHHSPHQRYWIEALSINHADEIELNQQAGQMSRVMASADEVYAWFGATDDLAPNTLKTPRRRTEAGEQFEWTSSDSRDVASALSRSPLGFEQLLTPELMRASRIALLFGKDRFDMDRQDFASLVAQRSTNAVL